MFTKIAAIQTSPNEPSMPIKLVNGSRNLAK